MRCSFTQDIFLSKFEFPGTLIFLQKIYSKIFSLTIVPFSYESEWILSYIIMRTCLYGSLLIMHYTLFCQLHLFTWRLTIALLCVNDNNAQDVNGWWGGDVWMVKRRRRKHEIVMHELEVEMKEEIHDLVIHSSISFFRFPFVWLKLEISSQIFFTRMPFLVANVEYFISTL